MMKLITHVIPTNSLFYSLYVQSFTQLLHVLMLLSHHLQGADTKISWKHSALK